MSGHQLESQPITICVQSTPSPEPTHTISGLPVVQRQIDYEIRMHDRDFIFPGVWALQTVKQLDSGVEQIETYFAEPVSNLIMDAIFRHCFPHQAELGDLLARTRGTESQ